MIFLFLWVFTRRQNEMRKSSSADPTHSTTRTMQWLGFHFIPKAVATLANWASEKTGISQIQFFHGFFYWFINQRSDWNDIVQLIDTTEKKNTRKFCSLRKKPLKKHQRKDWKQRFEATLSDWLWLTAMFSQTCFSSLSQMDFPVRRHLWPSIRRGRGWGGGRGLIL